MPEHKSKKHPLKLSKPRSLGPTARRRVQEVRGHGANTVIDDKDESTELYTRALWHRGIMRAQLGALG